MIRVALQRSEHPFRFLKTHADPRFLEDRLQQFVAPFAPFAMLAAGAVIAFTIAMQWLRNGPEPGLLLFSLLAVCAVSGALSMALRWAASELHANLACVIGCLYVGSLSALVTAAYAGVPRDLTSSLAFVAIIAIAPVVFWVRLAHYVAGFTVAFAPSIVTMAIQRASLDEWTLLLMVIVFSAVVGSMGLFVITACLYLIYEQNKALHSVSQEDDLTGLFRRRYWIELAGQQLHRLELLGQPATLLYLDLDGFKEINDSQGHNVGDDVLRATADALRSVVPLDAITGRPGGDEFIALLPRTRTAQAQAVERQLRECLRHDGFPARAMQASIGIAEWRAGEALEELIDRADQAMLREKGETRRRYYAMVTERAMRPEWEPAREISL